MINILIGIATILIYSLICYVFCRFTNGKHFNIKDNYYKDCYLDTFKYLWVTILVLGYIIDLLDKMVLYILGKLI
jgi:hypothetical protein